MPRHIPSQHLNEFLNNRAGFIKKRVRLFCIFATCIYLFVTTITIIFYPNDFRNQEAPLGVLLISGSILILALNNKLKGLKTAKFNAYLFTVFILTIITKMNLLYSDSAAQVASVYVFTLFLVAFIIPWAPLDVAFISALHVAAYSIFFLSVRATINIGFQVYFDGIIFLIASAILAFVMRRKEMERDIENFILIKEIESKNEIMRRELELATQIHKTLVPKSISTNLVDIAVMYLPVSYLSGDYAGFHFIDKEKLVFIICDVTGHGVSAALLVNRLHVEFEKLAGEGKKPGILLKELDEFIAKVFSGTNMYLSAFCGFLDFKSRRFIYSNYGHPTQYLYRLRESRIVKFQAQGALLGLSLNDEDIYQNEIDFEAGDKMLLFTDGVLDTRGKDGQEFGENRLEEFIKENCGQKQVELLNQSLVDQLSAFKGASFNDDIFLLTMAIK